MSDPIDRPPTSWGKTAAPILALTGPATLSRAGLLGVIFVDSVMVGRVGVEQLAYFAIAAQPAQSFASMGQGLAAGLPAQIASAQVHGAMEDARRWLTSSLVVAAIMGILLAGLMSLGEALLTAARQPQDIAHAGEPVLRAFAWGMPAVLMFWSTSLYFESLGRPHVPLIIVTAAVAAKILFNLIFVFGWWHIIPPMGALGAAIATSLLRWLMLLAILVLAAWQGLGTTGFDASDAGRRILTLMRVGAPVACGVIFEVSAFLTLASFAGILGAEALAGQQIARSIYQVPFIAATALGLAVSIFLARRVSQGDRQGGRRVVSVGLDLISIVAIGAGGVVALFPIAIGSVFTNDIVFVETMRVALVITAVLIVFDGFQGFLNATLRGLSDGLVPTIIQLTAFWAVAVPLAYFLAFERGWGFEGVLIGLTAGLAVASLLLGVRLFTHPKLRRTAASS